MWAVRLMMKAARQAGPFDQPDTETTTTIVAMMAAQMIRLSTLYMASASSVTPPSREYL